MTESPSDTARQRALDRIDRSERGRYKFVIALTAVEMIFIWGFAQLADFSNRVHVLIFWATLSSYAPMTIGLGILWAHVSRSTRLVLKAIDLATRRIPGEPTRASGPLGLRPDR